MNGRLTPDQRAMLVERATIAHLLCDLPDDANAIGGPADARLG